MPLRRRVTDTLIHPILAIVFGLFDPSRRGLYKVQPGDEPIRRKLGARLQCRDVKALRDSRNCVSEVISLAKRQN